MVSLSQSWFCCPNKVLLLLGEAVATHLFFAGGGESVVGKLSWLAFAFCALPLPQLHAQRDLEWNSCSLSWFFFLLLPSITNICINNPVCIASLWPCFFMLQKVANRHHYSSATAGWIGWVRRFPYRLVGSQWLLPGELETMNWENNFKIEFNRIWKNARWLPADDLHLCRFTWHLFLCLWILPSQTVSIWCFINNKGKEAGRFIEFVTREQQHRWEWTLEW